MRATDCIPPGPEHTFFIFRLSFFAGVSLLVAVATSCGDDSEPTLTPAPSRTTARTASPIATASPHATATTPPRTPEPMETAPAPAIEAPPIEPAPTVVPPLQPPAAGLLVVVDKERALPADYVPPGLTPLGAAYLAPGFGGSLRAEAKSALERMLSAAFDGGNDIYARSAYRSYAEQERTFAYWVSVLGEAEARRVSAEPGHSEHQLGTTADLTTAEVGYDLTEALGTTPAGRWLVDNAHAYGFALSYPAGAEAITGYAYEPWHYRYVGPEPAAAWKASGLTLVEYLRGVGG